MMYLVVSYVTEFFIFLFLISLDNPIVAPLCLRSDVAVSTDDCMNMGSS